jgi:hypothetical protein
MRFVGIDVGPERHAVAIVNERGKAHQKPFFVGEEAAGYRRLRALFGCPSGRRSPIRMVSRPRAISRRTPD